MNQVINGKRYDIHTARQLAEWSRSAYVNDWEALYLKRTGELFLDRWDRLSGERIVPLDDVDGRRYAEEHLSADEYEAVFGPVGE